MLRKLGILLATLIAMGSLSACDSLAYYAQAVSGQVSVLWRRQSIEQLLADPALDRALRQKLLLVQQATQYAEQHLGLSADGSYDSYVELPRRHLVWNVVAAPEFSTQPVSWCFPIAGCVDYRGYFSETAALGYAEDLQRQGLDVFVGGVDAYSTLGWFNDPVPSTIIQRSDHQLVTLIFHELAHQELYVPGDTSFNESFASFVGQEGLRRWLAEQNRSELYQQTLQDMLGQQRFIDFVLDFRSRFAALYGSGMDADTMRAGKRLLQNQMRQSWHEHAGHTSERYQGWFLGPLNNAQLATVGSYYEWVPAFENLFAQTGSEFSAFYRAVAEIASLSSQARQNRLAGLMPPV